jgi:hypothetical protein
VGEEAEIIVTEFGELTYIAEVGAELSVEVATSLSVEELGIEALVSEDGRITRDTVGVAVCASEGVISVGSEKVGPLDETLLPYAVALEVSGGVVLEVDSGLAVIELRTTE